MLHRIIHLTCICKSFCTTSNLTTTLYLACRWTMTKTSQLQDDFIHVPPQSCFIVFIAFCINVQHRQDIYSADSCFFVGEGKRNVFLCILLHDKLGKYADYNTHTNTQRYVLLVMQSVTGGIWELMQCLKNLYRVRHHVHI